LGKRIEKRRFRHGENEHVGFVDGLPAADRRAVEAQALLERALFQLAGRDGEMLPQAGEIHETKVNGLHLVFFDQAEYFLGIHSVLLNEAQPRTPAKLITSDSGRLYGSRSGFPARQSATRRAGKPDLRSEIDICNASDRRPIKKTNHATWLLAVLQG